MKSLMRGPEVMASPPSPEKKTSATNTNPPLRKSPALAHGCDRELHEAGFVRSHDGMFLDNRDGFYDSYPSDYLKVYDSRTYLCISRSLFEKLLLALEAA